MSFYPYFGYSLVFLIVSGTFVSLAVRRYNYISTYPRSVICYGRYRYVRIWFAHVLEILEVVEIF